MSQDAPTPAPVAPSPVGQLLAKVRGLPKKLQLALWGGLLGVAALIAYLVVPPANTASLQLRVEHSFRSAEVTVTVDDRVVYQGKSAGSLRKRYGLIPEGMHGSLVKSVLVPDGQHTVQVRVVAPAEGYDQVKAASGTFSSATDNSLLVNAYRSGVTLSWQGGQVVAAQAENVSWMQKYASSLLLSLFGTILSAIIGFVVQEFMKKRLHKSVSA